MTDPDIQKTDTNLRNDDFWLKILLGSSIAIFTCFLLLDKKKKKRLDDIIKMIDWTNILDKENELHKPLICVSTELSLMLKKSIINKDGKYKFEPEYPLSLSTLVRSTYEQSIKLYMNENRILIPEDDRLVKLEKILFDNLNNHTSNMEIKECLEGIINLDMRKETNRAAHSPDKNKSIAPVIEENTFVFRFVNLIMRDAKQQKN